LVRFLVNFALLALTSLAQWRIGRLAATLLAKRQSPRAVRLFRALLPLAGAALLAGFLLGFTEIRGFLPFTSPLVGIFSGLAQVWLLTSSSVYGLYLLLRLISRLVMGRVPFDPSRRRLVHTAGGALLASPFVVVGYGAFVERTNFRVREVDIPIPHLAADLDGLRLLQLSDIHLSPFLSEQDLQRVIEASNETRAHLALVTGDLISTRGDPLDACLRRLSTLKTDAGILACMGNHEHFSGAERYATEQGALLGIRFLRRQNMLLRFGGAALNIAGVDYEHMAASHKGYLRGAERMVVPGATNVLLSHNPDVFPIAAAQGYDLTVSGHTHGGQVNIEILSREINPALFFTPYVYGLYRLAVHGRGAAAYVSRGIGTIGIPARVGAPPEISLLRLRKTGG
jgi:predicted MPP superfamily phosphohydrolase